jgi:hypothetical protein
MRVVVMLVGMRRTRDRLTDQQWRRVFQRQRRSGLSIAAFCERERLATSTFFAKRRQLEAEPEERTPTAAFVEVTPADDHVAHQVAACEPEGAIAAVALELVLRGGVIVRVREGFDASLLRRVVNAIGGGT